MTGAGVVDSAALAVAWIGHACLLIPALNHCYGRPIPKWFLRLYRLATGIAVLGFPLLILSAFDGDGPVTTPWGFLVLLYVLTCVVAGGVAFPAITVARLIRPTPRAVLAERTETVDYWPELGRAAIGNGKHAWAPRLPFNCVLRVDYTDQTLAVPRLPAGWDGLTVLFLSDLHFHGTPSRQFYDRVFDRLAAAPPPDLVVLAGDFLDSDAHHGWIGELLGRLTATQGKYAVLGNHDKDHDPERVRKELAAAGYAVLGNGWREATIRGERVVLVGHEGPWFRPGPDLTAAPRGPFRLCLSHSPDNFYWGQRNHVDLMLCGHVHGGQVRFPVLGSIFVPSVFSRRFDMGVFEEDGTVMAVGRGLSGKEPLRFRCNPQVIRLTLKPG